MAMSYEGVRRLAVLGWAAAAALAVYQFRPAISTPAVSATVEQASPAKYVPPAPPTHHYAVKDGYEYSYERELSAADRNLGAVTSPMVTIRFLGEREGRYQVFHKLSEGLINIYECPRICEVVTTYVYINESIAKTEKMRVTPGSLVGAIFEDAVGGKLATFLYQRNGKAMQGFVSKDGTMRFFAPA